MWIIMEGGGRSTPMLLANLFVHWTQAEALASKPVD